MVVMVEKLLKREDFLLLKAQGRRVFRPAFVAQFLPIEEPVVRVGYTASSKGIGNAVKRNRARRRLKAAVDAVLRLNEAAVAEKGFKLTLVARVAVLDQDFAVMMGDLRTACQEVGITC